MITLIIMTDGRRDYLQETINSLGNLVGPISQRFIHDDSGDESFRWWLNDTYANDYQIYSTGGRSGFAGAIQSAWSLPIANNWVWHQEDDFVITEQIDLYKMINVMTHSPHLIQMALRRQPWNEQERAAGGIVEQHPDSYTDKTDGYNHWLEHRRFFTTNPSLYNTSLINNGWPSGPSSEGMFAINVFSRYPDKKSGFWGKRSDIPKCHHIGVERVGYDY